MEDTGWIRTVALGAALASLGGLVAVRALPAREPIAQPAPGRERGNRDDEERTRAECENGLRTAFGEFLGMSKAERQDPTTYDRKVSESFRTLVVTIPDPIDSRLDSDFDETLTALSLAAAIRGYALDRFWLPWSVDRRDLEPDGSPGHCHTRQPGVVLYRGAAQSALGDRHLALLLVGETPTTGIHRVAMARALEMVRAAGDEKAVRVLGPSFSGTAPSLTRELGRFRDRDRRWKFTIVTGSATAIPREAGGESATLQIRSAVHDDQEMWEVLDGYLKELGICHDEVAVLMESDTAYGASITPKYYAGTLLRFPTQISRIRSDYQQQRVRQQVMIGGHPLPPEALELRLDVNHDPRDVLPALTDASENYAEEVLASQLDALKMHPVRAVGIIATDPLDKTFLVSKVRERVPEVLVFTFESSLLFLHPDVRRDMYGSVVVSTYPLLLEAQSWGSGGPPLEQLQFPSSNAEGVYNAALLLLADGADPQVLGTSEHVRDYEYPFEARVMEKGCPPVWISVVGLDALWPVRVASCEGGKPSLESAVLLAPTAAARAAAARSRAHAPHASLAMLLFTALVVVCAAVTALSTVAGRGSASARAGSPRFHRAWIIAHLVWLAVIVLALSVLLFIPFAAGLGGEEGGADWTLDGARLAAAVTGLVLAAAAWEGWIRLRWQASTWMRVAASATTFALGLAVMYWLAPALAKLAARADRTWALLFFERAVHLGSGVSPVVPLLFPALAIYLWTYSQLLRIRLLHGQDQGSGDLMFRRFVGGGDPVLTETDRRLVTLLRGGSSWHEVLLRTGIFALPALVILFYAGWLLHSPDGRRFDGAFVALLAAVIVITGHSLVRASTLWWALRTALERLPLLPIGRALKRLPSVFQQQRLKRLFLGSPQYVDLQLSYEIFCKGFPPPTEPEAHERIEGCLARDRREPLRARWDHETLAALADAAAAASAAESSAGGPCEHAVPKENFVASQLALKVLWALAHLRVRLAHLVLSALAILAAVAFYPLQPHWVLMLLIWMVVLGAAGTAVFVYVQHARNEVLSWLSGTTPGRVNFDAEHVLHFVTLGAAPLLALLALQFPTFVHWVAGWLGPLLGGGG
jgi:hypothetical protein